MDHPHNLDRMLDLKGTSMTEDRRAVAETAFQRAQKREQEISAALKLEQERREATIRNMQRLRELRLSQVKAHR